jgi:DNA polymerase-3 subunit alpha
MGNDKKLHLSAEDYVHLHNHTHHSLLDGLSKVPELISRVKDLGMKSCAITDHGTMSGAIEFYKQAKSQNIKPIIGIETYVASRSRLDKDPSKDKARFHLILLAMNETGYKNLMQLSTKANLEGMYYKPRIDHELLEEFNEGIICLSGCASSELGENLKIDNYDEAKKIAKWYKQIFGDRYYLELQDHGHPDNHAAWDVQVRINSKLLQLSDELDIPCVVTSDGHYIDHSDQDAHEILLCVGTASYRSETNRMSLKDFELHVTDPREIIKRWQATNPQAIMNTKIIAERCNLEIQLGGILIPRFPTPDGQSEKDYLHSLVWDGLLARYSSNVAVYEHKNLNIEQARKILGSHIVERAEYELGIMDTMGYNGYFLIVQDFINWGKKQGIIFGPGRGSAAGSIVAYALNITDLDPLKYDLLFERFLNPDRISMPDIDIDIQDTRRNEVIEYCANKYGADRVANIVTFGKMAARAAVRDVARVLEVPYAEADRLSKMIPAPIQGRHIPLAESVKNDADLKSEYENNQVAQEVFDFAIRLEGTIRSHGVHAAGVVIAPDEIVQYTPLELAQKGVIATQYPMGPIEELGLLKMDFLGLSNLSIINNALRIIKKVYKDDIQISEIPLDDKLTYELFQKGDTTGVFQLESAGMKRYLRELKPTVFDDIIAMVALYRPGPMQFIDSFIRRKHGDEQISYLHKGMENSLKNTYGILVYQEQFMQISKEWAGFTGGQADTLRKAVGKKNIELMKKVKPEFVDGAIKHGGATKQVAEKFWDQLEEFANYCFNKSHAACYGLIAYWTAYLKAHYPDAFMAALMTSDADNIERLAIEINECKHMGIAVLAPDINESFVEFAIVPGENKIRFGMAAIKGVGVSAVEEVLRARDAARFASIEDFASRVSTTKFNKRAWESLIKSGGFDSLGDRAELLHNLEVIQAFASKTQKELISGQTDLFGSYDNEDSSTKRVISLLPAPHKISDKVKLTWERELMGLYISAHPLDNYEMYLREQTLPLSSLSLEADGKKTVVGGIISNFRTILTKAGTKMAFVTVEDKFSETEVIIFPNLYKDIGPSLALDTIVRVSGKINSRDKDGSPTTEVKIIADEMFIVSDKELASYESTGGKVKQPKVSKASKKVVVKKTDPGSAPKPEESNLKTLYVQVKDPDNLSALSSFKAICADFPGVQKVVLVLGDDRKSAIRMPFGVDYNETLLSRLRDALGEDSVKLR